MLFDQSGGAAGKSPAMGKRSAKHPQSWYQALRQAPEVDPIDHS